MAASAGLQLDEWQQFVLLESLGLRQGGRWAAFGVGLIVPRQNGKGSILEARELAALFLFGERLILHSAHEFKTCAEAYIRVKGLIENTPELDAQVRRYSNAHGAEGIELKNGSRLRFVARTGGSGRGFTGDVVILDEAYQLPMQVIAALTPTMLARPNPQLWYASSAGMPDSDVLRGVRERGSSGARRLAYFEWSVPKPAEGEPDIDVYDEALWAQANPGYGIRITRDTMESLLDELGDSEEFRRECLGIWDGEGGNALIPSSNWFAALDPESEPTGAFRVAVDVSANQDTTAVAIAGKRADGLMHVEVLEFDIGTAWVVEFLADLADDYSDEWDGEVLIDANGPAGAIVAALENADVKLRRVSAVEMSQACGSLYASLVPADKSAPTTRHLVDVDLSAAVEGARKREMTDGAWRWSRTLSVADIAPLVAVTVARWAAETDEGDVGIW